MSEGKEEITSLLTGKAELRYRVQPHCKVYHIVRIISEV